MAPSTRIFNPHIRILNQNTRNNLKGCVRLEPRNTRTKRNTKFGQNTIHSHHLQRRISSVPDKKSAEPQQAPSEQDQPQDNPDPVFYREVDMSDFPSQYAKEVEIFRYILNLPDPRETMPRPFSYAPFKSISQRCLWFQRSLLTPFKGTRACTPLPPMTPYKPPSVHQ